MTADSRTLLAHIALEFGTHPENIAVEALGYILSSSEPAVRALEEVLRTGGVDVGQLSEVRTQASGEDGARPDLAGYDVDRAERVLIEAKFWAGLTDNQPTAYLERLPTDKSSALLFVAPAARLETLWAELIRRVAESGAFTLESSSEEENLRSAVVGGGCRLMLTSWKALLDRMASHASVAGDSRTETDIRQLLGLTQRMDEDAFLPILSGELGPELPRRINNLRRLLIPNVVRRGREAGWVNTSGMAASGNENGYGQNMRLGHDVHTCVWLGYNFYDWARFRETPMWLKLGDQDWRQDGLKSDEVRRRLQPLQQEDPPGIIDRSNRLLVPIYLPVGVEETAVVDSVVAQLERVARMIDPNIDPVVI